ncbi:hypothetical protein Q7P37_001339 [Cladosporium fusiforme]
MQRLRHDPSPIDQRLRAATRTPSPSSSQEKEEHHVEEPSRKRARTREYQEPPVPFHHTGHRFQDSIARDNARVQYGDVHNVYHAASATPGPAPEHSDDVLESLSFVQMDVRQENIARAHSNTCRWLYDRCEYKAWRDPTQRINNHGFFWIKSKPGAGKSTLMKFLLSSAKQQLPQDKIISFFFNARGHQLEQSIEGMYRHLLYQLLDTIPRLQSVLTLSHAASTPHQQGWPIEKLKSLFREAVLSLEEDRLTCFIDALDECPEDQVRDLIEFLEDLGHSATSKAIDFHICFSSRHYPYVNIEKCQHFILDGQEGHQQDIASYVETKLRGKGKKVGTTKAAVQEKAHGVFLWAVLVVQILNKEIDRGNIHNLQRRLAEIPAGLHELFQDILNRDAQDNEYLIPVLRWTMYAKRPLSREELYFAIHGGAQDPIALNPWDSEEVDLSVMDLFILNSSKGLAEMTQGKKPTVQFIHESVRDYLRHTGLEVVHADLDTICCGSLDGLSHNYLKRCCLQFLSKDMLQHLHLPSPLLRAKSDEAKQLRSVTSSRFPFLEYACSYIAHHAEQASSHGIPQGDFVESFPVLTWVKIHNTFAIYDNRRLGDLMATPATIFAQQAMWDLFTLGMRSKILPIRPPQIEAALRAALSSDRVESLIPIFEMCDRSTISDMENIKTLKLAIKSKSLRSVQFVLSRDPVPKSRPVCDLLFQEALDTGELDVLTCLANRIDEDSVSEHYRRDIMKYAIHQGHEALVRPYLGSNIINYAEWSGSLRQMLGDAFKNGHESIGILLIETIRKDASANVFNDVLLTTMHQASSAGQDDIIRLLLTYGGGAYALLKASRNGWQEMVRQLLREGVSINSLDARGRSALHEASSKGHETTVQLLLERGADVKTSCAEGRTALHEAARNGHESTVRLLIKQGAQVNTLCNAGCSALREAVENGHHFTVRVLLEKEENELYSACCKGQVDIVLLLLDRGVEMKSQTHMDGETFTPRTPLAGACLQGHEAVVRLLLEQGAPLSETLTQLAVIGNITALRLLLDSGANMMTDDGVALRRACLGSDEKCVELLLAHRVDLRSQVSVPTYQIELVREVARRGDARILALLLDHGISFRAQIGKAYGEALEIAITWGLEETAQIFRERGVTSRT